MATHYIIMGREIRMVGGAEKWLRKRLVAELDCIFDDLCDTNFRAIEEYAGLEFEDDEIEDIETIFMAMRNTINNFECSVDKLEYKKYEVK